MTEQTTISKSKLLPSTRIALAAFLHDLGKFAERARLDSTLEIIESNKQLYCKHHKKNVDDRGWYSHIHSAYTAIAIDLIESRFPDLKGDNMSPFSDWKSKDADDSLINAAARHHNPDSYLQWIIATADRVASGFDREEFDKYNQAPDHVKGGKNHYTTRLYTLMEKIWLDRKKEPGEQQDIYRYPLKPLSPESIFPVEVEECEGDDTKAAQQEYRVLWDSFFTALEKIPTSHQRDLTLWLDHFETIWGVYTHAIPSATAFGVRPDVSLYDHSRTTAALATALWRYHDDCGNLAEEVVPDMRNRDDWGQKKFLLIQGDFFGIQDFIFANGGQTQKMAAKLLRGRSFYVSLLTECAGLKVLEELELPPTSQVINAAGKFLIVAPNTKQTKEKLQVIQKKLNNWFLKYSWGQSGIGLAWLSVSCNDFLKLDSVEAGKNGYKRPFQKIMKQLFEQLEIVKLQQMNLCSVDTPSVFDDYLDEIHEKGVCQVDGRSPARHEVKGICCGDLARDQIQIGYCLTRYQRLLITRQPLNNQTLGLPVFDYYITFTGNQEDTGKFGNMVSEKKLLRCWDFSLPESADQVLFSGFARRFINAYIPVFDQNTKMEIDLGKYIESDIEPEANEPKTLNDIACENRLLDADGKTWKGVSALITLKGDVDNLGQLFQQGLGDLTFAKMASFSRQVNAFFAIYLPWLCQSESKFGNTYTVFAGGDDFFLIGPWLSQIKLASRLKDDFGRYVAKNPDIHFSAGLSMTRPGMPIPSLAMMAENALEGSKNYNPKQVKPEPKNAVTCFNRSMFWEEYDLLLEREGKLDELVKELNLSTGYVYSLLNLIDMAEKVSDNPQNAIWRSYFVYRTRRMLERCRELNEEKQKKMMQQLADEIVSMGIDNHGKNYRVALFTHLYQQRK